MIKYLSRLRRALRSQHSNSRSRADGFPETSLSSEVLESRLLLSAIVGTVYDDVNFNGVLDNGENGLANWIVYLDLDNSGTRNNKADGTPEPSARTNVDGDYTINGVLPGSYRVAEVVKAGWTPTTPASKDVKVTSTADSVANFFNFAGGSIVGTVWNDLNADGIRGAGGSPGTFSDPGLAGWTVFLDINNNSSIDPAEPTTLTNASGRYSFSNVPAGDYEVTEVQPAGWDVSPTFDIKQTATVAALTSVSQDFANFSLVNGAIHGTVWNDMNADGVRQTNFSTGAFTEPGLADWTIFLDLNGNHSLDVSESSTTTDSNGIYSFISLPAGDYEVTEVLPAGWNPSETFDIWQTVSVVAGESTAARDFANFTVLNGSIRGSIWNDINRDGVRNQNLSGAFMDPGLGGWSVYLDLNRNNVFDPSEPTALTDLTGAYYFHNLQVGDYHVIEIIPSGWETAPTFGDNQTVTVFSGAEALALDFANFNLAATSPGSVRGIVWNDLNGNGILDNAPVVEPGLSGWKVFIDLNSNGVLDGTEPQATTAANGSYTISSVQPGTIRIVEILPAGWHATGPITGKRSLTLRNGENAVAQTFGNQQLQNSSISGVVFADTDKNSLHNATEKGLAGITIYVDLNNNAALDLNEPRTLSSEDLYFTPTLNEAGSFSFSHLAIGTYTLRQIIPAVLSSTPAIQLSRNVTIAAAENRIGVDFADVFRPNEIHGVKFADTNNNHLKDAGETGIAGTSIFLDLNRNDFFDAGETGTTTLADGSYSFTNLSPGAYVVREVDTSGFAQTYPTTVGGILWPVGTSNPSQGNVGPLSITTSLAAGQTHRETVSLTLPSTGALTNAVDVFLLFDDTGSFVNNSPVIRSAFPTIISQLQASLTGVDLAFGVGRFEDYANFAYEYSTGRPFVLNQPMVAASTPGYLTAIQAALNRTTPGYGGDQPETDIEALYQLVTGAGFDGNNNGSVLDSGPAGLSTTQLSPDKSGDVPSFASFTSDAPASVLPPAGNIGGAGFRAGALPVILLATDTGFAYQPKGETSVNGLGGLSLPVSAFTQTSRASTPFNSGAGIQETITGLNALGALVIGLGTNTQANVDPRQGLEAISKLTGATNQTLTTIANGTTDPIAPGDPMYFQISTGFAGSVADGVQNAIQNAVTNVAVNMTIKASDPRVKIISHTGILNGLTAGQMASFDVEFVGDGIPHRFDLQFVREGTNVVLGSIPVVIGTPIPGDGYQFDDLQEGEIEVENHFGVSLSVPAPPEIFLSAVSIAENRTAGTTIGSFSTTPTTGNTYSYALVAGDGSVDNGHFTISGNRLKANESFDFEFQGSYSIRVRSTDQLGQKRYKVFTISVLNQPEGTAGNDTFVLSYSGMAPGGTVTITVSTNGGPVSSLGTFPLFAPLTLSGLGGNDSVLINGTVGTDVFTISSAALTINAAPLMLDSIETKKLAGGVGNDTYRFDADAALGLWTLDEAGGGTDTVDFTPTTTVGLVLNLATSGTQAVHATNLSLILGSAVTIENATGGSGADTLFGNTLNNTLTGGAGDDKLLGAGGNDVMRGGVNNDTYIFVPTTVAEADQVTENASEGIDTLNFGSLTTSVVVNLGSTSIQTVNLNRTLRLNSAVVFENLDGGSGADTLFGNTLNNTLTGGAGDDKLLGAGGNDVMRGGVNNDTYIFVPTTVAEADQVTENASEGIDTLNFGSLTTSVVVNLGSTSIQTVNLNRTLRLNSLSTFENAVGGTGSDTLFGNVVANRLTGGLGNNILVGMEGGDILEAGSGRDILIGGLGLDILKGDAGDDILIAGRTTSDTSLSNLSTLRTQWISGNAYATRITNLRAGVGSPLVSLKAKINVLNDAGEDDVLCGGTGTDWFFRAVDDVIADLFAGEILDLL